MSASVFPAGNSMLLRQALLPVSLLDAPVSGITNRDGLVQADLLVRDGRIVAIGASLQADGPSVDLQGGQVWPACVELHTHLDKGHIWPRAGNPDGTTMAAAEAVARDRTAHWSPGDIERRFDFSLRCAWAHGTGCIRTHIDSYGPQVPISWPVFRRMRDAWTGRITLQGVCLTVMDSYEGAPGAALADLVAEAGGILGARLASALQRLFMLADERGLDVDLHVDETAELEPNTLKQVALAVLSSGFRGRVVCGHCCSLALRPEAEAAETIALVRDAGICIVSLPMVNLYLQSRGTLQTPRWRGVTPIRELRAAGVPVAVASDNTRDPFYRFGDLDAIELFREAVRICHLDDDCGSWVQAVTRWPADIMGLPASGRLAIGAMADLIAFRARSFDELLARPQSDRVVLRGGRVSDAMVPDYRELDTLFHDNASAPANDDGISQ